MRNYIDKTILEQKMRYTYDICRLSYSNRLSISVVRAGRGKNGIKVFRIFVMKKPDEIEYEKYFSFKKTEYEPDEIMKVLNSEIEYLYNMYFNSDFDVKMHENKINKKRKYANDYYHSHIEECTKSRSKYKKTKNGLEGIKIQNEKQKTPVKGYTGRRNWEPDEVKFLIENRNSMTIMEMAIKLERSFGSVLGKVNRLIHYDVIKSISKLGGVKERS